MKLALAALLLFTTIRAHAAVLEAPTTENTVAIAFATCPVSVQIPGHGSSEPGNAHVQGLLNQLPTKKCTDREGSVIGTPGLVAVGTVATLERDAPSLSSYPAFSGQPIGTLTKGTKVRVLSFSGVYSGLFNGNVYAIVQVLE